MQARALYPDNPEKLEETVRAARERLMGISRPRTTSPLERGIKEYRRRTDLWMASAPGLELLISSRYGW